MKNYKDELREWAKIHEDDPALEDLSDFDSLYDLKEFARDLKNNGNGLDLSDFCYSAEIYDASEVKTPFEEYESYNNFYNKKEKENMNELELLDKVTSAATFLYTKNMGDTIAPNILISQLPNKQCYVSLNRYITPTDRYQKTIVFKTTRKSSKEALMDVAKFLAKQKIVTKINPLEELEILIDEDNFGNNI